MSKTPLSDAGDAVQAADRSLVRPDQVEGLRAQRDAFLTELQTMLDTPEDQRPAGKALKAWVAQLDSTRRMLEQLSRLLQMVEQKPKKRPRAVVAAQPSSSTAPEESDAVVLAMIPKGPRAELRVVVKTWRGRRVFDVRCWSLRKDTGEYGPTRKGVTVDAKMLPALVEALQLALKHA